MKLPINFNFEIDTSMSFNEKKIGERIAEIVADKLYWQIWGESDTIIRGIITKRALERFSEMDNEENWISKSLQHKMHQAANQFYRKNARELGIKEVIENVRTDQGKG